MKNRFTRIISLSIGFVLLVSTFAGCDQPKSNTSVADTSNLPWGEKLASYKDSSDIPSWTGKKMSLNYWMVDGGGGISNYLQGSDDVVRKEIERVTGVKIDENNSFDNNGVNFDIKYTEVNT
jgi:hypothetical protein